MVILGTYKRREMREVCEEVISEITDMSWLSKGDSVFVKVACNSPRPHPAVTDPEAVEAVVGFLRDHGARIVIVGDQGGVEHVRLRSDGRRRSSTQVLMRSNGLLGAVVRSGAALQCFDDRGWDDGYFKPELDFINNWHGRMWLPKILRKVDHIIYLPRLGAHVISGYTCGIKNAVGFLRDDSRLYLHQRGATFHEKVTEINHVREIREKLRFCLTMGRSAMTNYGPDYGERYDFDGFMALCSDSLVDHDSVASALLPWLDDQRKSIHDIYNPNQQADLWNKIVVYLNWGKGAMADYEPISLYNPCTSYLAQLQEYQPEQIEVYRRGDAFFNGWSWENLYVRLLGVDMKRLEKLGRIRLRELLAKCTDGQVKMFNKLYTSIDVIPLDKMECALDQVERTIVKNNEKRLKLEEMEKSRVEKAAYFPPEEGPPRRCMR